MSLSVVDSAISYDDAGTTWNSNAFTKTTGTASGDLALIPLSWYANSFNPDPLYLILTPTDFSVAQAQSTVSGSGSTGSYFNAYYRQCDGTEGASYTLTRNGGASMYGTGGLITFRGSSALTFVSCTAGSTGSSQTSLVAPSVSGTAGQGLICIYAITDPSTVNTGPSGMTQALAGAQNTNTLYVYYETLSATGATGTRTLVVNTARDYQAFSILVSGAETPSGPSITVVMHYYNRMRNQ